MNTCFGGGRAGRATLLMGAGLSTLVQSLWSSIKIGCLKLLITEWPVGCCIPVFASVQSMLA